MDSISRRQFVSAVGAAAATMAIGRSATGEAPASAPVSAPARRPNILLIMSDEHDPAVTGCYGDTIVRTPHLDSLAARASRLMPMYTTSPLCVPARLTFTAGKYVSRIGGWHNGCRLASDDYPSLPRILAAAGYRSYLAGKMHFDAEHRYGFEELYRNPPEPVPAYRARHRRDPGDTKPNVKAWQDRAKDFHTGDESLVMTHDRRVTQACREFFQSRKADDKPFFLLAGYLAPHFPLIVPREVLGATTRARCRCPRSRPGYLDTLPLNYKHLRVGFRHDGCARTTQFAGPRAVLRLDGVDRRAGRAGAGGARGSRAWPTTPSSSTPPTTARTWASTACGGRTACSTRPRGCR